MTRRHASIALSFSFYEPDEERTHGRPPGQPTHCGHCGMVGHRIEGCHVLKRGAREADRADELAAKLVTPGTPVGRTRKAVAELLRSMLEDVA